jgi:hypothetical protein
MIACFVGPSFHDGIASIDGGVCASAGTGPNVPGNAGSSASVVPRQVRKSRRRIVA